MRSDIGIITFPTEPWGPLWTTRHHVLSRLASHFPVEWMDPPHEWRDAWRVRRERSGGGGARNRRRLAVLGPALGRKSLGGPVLGGPAHAEDTFIVRQAEWWLPRVYKPTWVGEQLLKARMRRARAALIRRGCKRIVAYAWHYDFLPEVEALKHDWLLYHIVDEYSFSETEHPVLPVERTLITAADQVIVHSPALMEKKGHINPHTVMIPNGVDYHAFADPCPEPADLANIPHPRIGYAGFIKQQLDWALLLSLAKRHREWSWVFVGARQAHPEIDDLLRQLGELPNVHFLGAKPASELAKYPQHFDVALMPYRATDYTKYIYPLKLHEYLASGTPAVGTRIPSLEEFHDVVALVSSRESEWESAISSALDPAQHTPESISRRQSIAQRYDWDNLVGRIAQIISEGCQRL